MKLEKINNNSIRCIINGSELSTKYNIKLGEIIQGSGNTPKFFKDIIYRANKEFGFEPNDFPLIIEATSTPANEIAFTITKVNSKEELLKYNRHPLGDIGSIPQFNIDDQEPAEEADGPTASEESSAVFFFSKFNNLTKAAKIVDKSFSGHSMLYNIEDDYVLAINIGNMSFDSYYYAFDILSEYSDSYISSDDITAILAEHEEPLIESENVIATLAAIK